MTESLTLYLKGSGDMNYTNEVAKVLARQNELKIIISRDLYREKLSFIPEVTFYKILERLEKTEKIHKIAKGVFCLPQKTKFGNLYSSEKDIVDYFVAANSGMVVGYGAFNQLGITTQISKRVEVYSNKVSECTKHLKNVSIRNVNLTFSEDNKKAIQLMEILEHFSEIEDLNILQFQNVASSLLKSYNENNFDNVFKTIKYKKRTIAFLETLLNSANIENNMKKYLSATSEYEIPNLEGLYETSSI